MRLHAKTNAHLEILFQCSTEANRFTGHIRLSAIIQNVSVIPEGSTDSGDRVFWNPTIMALPYWSQNQYLVVSRIVTNGDYQENIICEANFCSPDPARRSGEQNCTEDDIRQVGPAGGLRCATPPQVISVPPTPAKHCSGRQALYTDIPGFHDPRTFYGGQGEPLMVFNTQSRYACFGLWLIDLRAVYAPLGSIISSTPTKLSLGPALSYRHVTELTRTPPSTRHPMEKNWFLFSGRTGETFVHYDIPGSSGRGRTFAKLLGNGLTSGNLTAPLEHPCLPAHPEFDTIPHPQKHWGRGHWHQATNALRLVLCRRTDRTCLNAGREERTVFFAAVHKKFSNHLNLPLRYERYFMVWAAAPPYGVLAVSRHPLLLANETASGWDAAENWEDDRYPRDGWNAAVVANGTGSGGAGKRNEKLAGEAVYGNGTSVGTGDNETLSKDLWAYFTYTVALAWVRNRPDTEVEDMQEGFLDDEVLLSIGVDDRGQAVARLAAEELLQCLWACPGTRV